MHIIVPTGSPGIGPKNIMSPLFGINGFARDISLKNKDDARRSTNGSVLLCNVHNSFSLF
jgi:hypothetical protein